MASMIMEKEVEEALQYIKRHENFILEGGAGSGKTHSLISIINSLTFIDPECRIVCITFTNNAVAEIKSRIVNKNIVVSTIHEFIWHLINKYQKEIKKILTELINAEEYHIFRKPKNHDGIFSFPEGIIVDYDEFYSMTPDLNNHVRITHDHILILAEKMFAEYEKLSDILKDMANCIFIDEYQDTDPSVIKILLCHLRKSKKTNVVGFFGDSMQSIYDNGVGDLNTYNLHTIQKLENRRNPKKIIELANKLRYDSIIQIPSKDLYAPNMLNGRIIEGSVRFIYGNEIDVNILREKNIFKDWDFSNPNQTKELRLTHALNAEYADFKKLYDLYNNDSILKLIAMINKKLNLLSEENLDVALEKSLGELVLEFRPDDKITDLLNEIIINKVYSSVYTLLKDLPYRVVREKCKIDRDSLMAYKLDPEATVYKARENRDRILKRLDILNDILDSYEDKNYIKFIKLTNFLIASYDDKIRLKKIIERLRHKNDFTIGKILKFSQRLKLLKVDELFDDYIANRGLYLWNRIKKIPFQEYRNSILYLKSFFPFSTQHSVKGSEFDNVLLILDSTWAKYNYKTIFGKKSPTESVNIRTRKLFYVCVTRAKKNLVVCMQTEDKIIINKASEYFGKENVIDWKELR